MLELADANRDGAVGDSALDLVELRSEGPAASTQRSNAVSLSGVSMKASRASAAGVAGAVGAVSLVTVATSRGLVSVTTLAATPRATGEGKIWLLLSSAFVADQPASVELIAFASFATIVLLVAGPFVLWSSAILGHVGSTLVLYGFIAVAGVAVPAAFDSVLTSE